MDNLRLWHKFLQIIKSEITPANFKAYFLKTLLKSVNEGKIILSAPSAFIVATLDRNYKNLIEATFAKILGKKISVEFVVKEFAEVATQQEEDFFQPVYAQTSTLNPKYTLENFVVGLSNNVAYAAALAVVQNPGTSYNPLFFYGGTGVGKTHLMLAVGNALLSKKPHLKIVYCSSEKFMNDYVEAIRNNKAGDIRSRYRSLDVLLIDDIQFFSGREGTQEEFFHTFNELQSKNSQMILTSDRPPNEIAKLEDRLKSRFQGGLMLDIQPPDFDTRVAILKAKCIERGETLPEETLNLLASSLETNIRELEGALVRILQTLKTQNLSPTEEVIGALLGQKPPTPISLSHKQVLSGLCEYFNIKLSDLTGPRRIKGLVLPRHLAMHILSEELKLTVERIGEILGGRDHTTVMHGRDKMKKLISTDREAQRIFIEVKQHLSTT